MKVTIFNGFPGNKKFKDGNLLEAEFNWPRGIVSSNGNLFVCDSNNHCIRKITMFIEWNTSNHSNCPKPIRDLIRMLMMIKNRRNNIWNQLPKDILFLIFIQINKHSTT